MEQALKTVLITSPVPGGFTDVLYFCHHGVICPEIKKVLDAGGVSFFAASLDYFTDIRDHLNNVGAVVIDPHQLDENEQHKLVKMLKTLTAENIRLFFIDEESYPNSGAAELGGNSEISFKTNSGDVISMTQFRRQLEQDINHRKASSGFGYISAGGDDRHIYRSRTNRLAERMQMAEALVGGLSEQLRMAGVVQRDFLPANLPSNEHIQWSSLFLPAEWVSGDIYDVSRIDEDHIGFYIADIVGHGVPAALLTIFLKQALVMRETVKNDYHIFSPSEIMANLNRRLLDQHLSGSQFATCCYCLLNTRSMELTYSRAGHPHPILIRSGGEPEQLEVDGALLGIFEQAQYPEQTIQLYPGDKLLLYSDGAESIIENFEDNSGFDFSSDLYAIKGLRITEMMNQLSNIVQSRDIKIDEVDDVTAVGLEII